MKKRPFGRTADGRAVEQVVLESADAAVSILSLGAIVRDWRIDGPSGSRRWCSASRRSRTMCITRDRTGRSAGGWRTGCGTPFTLDGREHLLVANEGAAPAARRPGRARDPVWEMDTDSGGGTVELRFASPDGDQGWPGAVDFTVSFRLRGAATGLRDARRARPADADQPRQPQLLQPPGGGGR